MVIKVVEACTAVILVANVIDAPYNIETKRVNVDRRRNVNLAMLFSRNTFLRFT